MAFHAAKGELEAAIEFLKQTAADDSTDGLP